MPLSSHGVLGAYCSRHPQIRIWGCPAAESLEAGRAWTGGFMATIDLQELDRLERRGLQLTVLSSVFVLILASGLAAFMYPLVFVHPEGNKWTLRVAFFGFCALTMLFLGYLFERQNTFHRLKVQLLAELERNVALQIQASADLLRSMPDLNFFWDRLSMEFRRAQTMEKTLSLVLVKVRRNRKSESDP